MIEHLLALRKKESYSGLHSATRCTTALTPFCTQEKKEHYSGLHSATKCTTALTPSCSKHTFQGKSNTLAPICAGAKLVLAPSCAKVTI